MAFGPPAPGWPGLQQMNDSTSKNGPSVGLAQPPSRILLRCMSPLLAQGGHRDEHDRCPLWANRRPSGTNVPSELPAYFARIDDSRMTLRPGRSRKFGLGNSTVISTVCASALNS